MKFNGLSESDLGILIEEPSEILGRAGVQYEEINIEGMDGSIFGELGFKTVDKSMIIQVIDPSKLDLILRTFKGEVIIEYNQRITTGWFYDHINVERMVFLNKMKVNYKRNPFWHVTNDDFTENLRNNGNVYSRPLIKLTRTNDDVVELTIGGIRFKYDFNGENHVIIDCENKTATREGISRNRNLEIGWDFPTFNPGENTLIQHLGNCNVQVKRKDRWL